MRHGVTAAPIIGGAGRALYRIEAIVYLGRDVSAAGTIGRGRRVAATDDRRRVVSGSGRSVADVVRIRRGGRQVG